MQKLLQKIRQLPKSPGVYMFKDKNGGVIYIGKAKNLRARVGQYFQGNDERPQIPFLMQEAIDLDYTIVANELESLYLERSFIQKYRPKYNIDLKDDKNYAFITIDYSAQIPQIGYARKFDPKNKQIAYFGPYTAANKIRETLFLTRKIFSFCANAKVGSKPCFYFHLHRCPGVCIGKMSLKDYKKHLNKIKLFLSGKIEIVTKDLKKEMSQAVKAKKFEAAARLRDQLRSLDMLKARQNMILAKKVNWDMVSLSQKDDFVCVNLFKVREGKLIGKENFIYHNPNATKSIRMPQNNSPQSPLKIRGGEGVILQAFLEEYYLTASDIPQVVYLQDDITDSKLIVSLLKNRANKKIELLVPQRGKAKQLIKLGAANAEEYLKNWLAGKAYEIDKTNAALLLLQEILELPKLPRRIEGFDISNIQGSNAVGSMVVFVDGQPAKSQYRKFKIKTKDTPDDYAMMNEMLARRLTRISNVKGQMSKVSAWPLPDLIVIDGGKGQLNAALEILNAKRYKLNAIPVIGLAKKLEEIFIPGRPTPIILLRDNPALQFLQRLRDEAHRFGIIFHRKLRSKQAIRSALDDIPGVGPKTKKLLKQKFGTIANIKKAGLDELSKAVGERMARLMQQLL